MAIMPINYYGDMTNRIPNIVQSWANSIANRNAKTQTSFYSKDALLLATYEPILIGQEEIYNYFIDLLSKKNIRCIIRENYSINNLEMIVASGLYTFSFEDDDNETINIPARYTFIIYRNRIIDHHSSEEPTK
jgi:hypothetical protein